MTVWLEIPGKPMGKQRPRHNRYTNATYTPEKTKTREAEIVIAYRKRYGSYKFPKGNFLEMTVYAYVPIPKKTPKAVREKMISRIIMPTVKPDGDNILKLVADALNGTAYDDDRQLVKMTVAKYYNEEPGTLIFLREYMR